MRTFSRHLTRSRASTSCRRSHAPTLVARTLLIIRLTSRNLAFLLTKGPADQVLNWANLDATKRKQLKQQYNDQGVSIVASAFGQTDLPTTQGEDPAALANTMAQFVLNTDLDGIDVDYEEIALVLQQSGVAEQWLTTFTQTLRQQLPKGQFILSHARTSAHY